MRKVYKLRSLAMGFRWLSLTHCNDDGTFDNVNIIQNEKSVTFVCATCSTTVGVLQVPRGGYS
jgi:hypothetical protein